MNDEFSFSEQGNSFIAEEANDMFVVQEGVSITVDDALSASSANPVENRVITQALNQLDAEKLDVANIDSALSASSANPVENKAVTIGKADIITDTASGSIVSISDAAPYPLNSVVVDIEPQQDLNGYDAPYPAGGGSNQWDEEWEAGIYNASGQPEGSSANIRSKNAIPVDGETTYYAYISGIPSIKVCYYDSSDTFISLETKQRATFTTPANCSYVRFSTINYGGTTYNHDIAVNYPSSVTTYSPYSNICPISGWTEAKVTRCGINIWDEEWELGGISSNGGVPMEKDDRIRSKNFCPCKPNTTYKSVNTDIDNGTHSYFWWYDADQNFISSQGADNYVRTSPSNAYYFKISTYGGGYTSYNNDFSINYPSTDTSYHAYSGNTYTIDLNGTRYGGTLNVTTGVLTVTHALWEKNTSTMNNSENYPGWKNSGIADLIGTGINTSINNIMMSCGTNYSVNTVGTYDILFFSRANYGSDMTQSAWQALAIDAQIVVELAEPFTVTLTAQQISALVGTNTMWADTGDITVTYRADTKKYIAKVIAAAISAL